VTLAAPSAAAAIEGARSMRILVLDINYPSDTNLYGDVFVHARVKGYVERGHDVHVLAFFTRGASYTFEGIRVTCVSTLDELREAIAAIAPDVIAIHFFQGWMLEKLLERVDVPVVVWVHGGEALGWYRRLFDVRVNGEFARYVASNVLQLSRMRRLYRYISSHRERAAIVFVSQWMRRIASIDTLSAVRPYSVIPNPIDTDLFPFERKDPELRGKILLIRSFGSRKYANDLAINAILALREHPYFRELSFTIVGSGQLFARLTAPLREMSNVTLVEGFMTRDAIQGLHKRHGVFLCPTRQDAQGVSMCEAMASGLVPITSKNTAIPEFVTDGESGYLCAGPDEIAAAMTDLWESPERFEKMSAAASRSIGAKASSIIVIPAELALMQSLAAQ